MLEIRRMQLEDLDAVRQIEEASFSVPWTKDDFAQSLKQNGVWHSLGRLRPPPVAEKGSKKEWQQHGDWQAEGADRADVATGRAPRSGRNIHAWVIHKLNP